MAWKDLWRDALRAHTVEVGWWSIAQCGREAFAIVSALQKGRIPLRAWAKVAVLDAMHLLMLERLQEVVRFGYRPIHELVQQTGCR